MPLDTALLTSEENMTKAVEYAIHEFAAVRTGKASPALVENTDIWVNSYGSNMKLKQLAMISTPEPRLIRIEPFDPSTLKDIERGINASNLGLNPSVEGKVIRLPVPELSTERRQQMVKQVKGMAEDARVRVRAVRRESMEELKKLEKAGTITEDDLHRGEKEVQAFTDKKIAEIDQHVVSKEKEILTV
ncbi:ribosome recycling factor [Verrucomicrobium spinosum]|uniref:ribosome recycling factor n=1 Tax=Verrucomicrobium spinosum TaxID=2736 RepID=UPI0001744D83|nr:ribosome recycling factor [Verrucomicrobium spinosum]